MMLIGMNWSMRLVTQHLDAWDFGQTWRCVTPNGDDLITRSRCPLGGHVSELTGEVLVNDE
jgi:hypothetical protein